MVEVLNRLKERQAYSAEYWKDTYPDMRPINNISGAEPMDNKSWELGFYEGLAYAVDVIEGNR